MFFRLPDDCGRTAFTAIDSMTLLFPRTCVRFKVFIRDRFRFSQKTADLIRDEMMKTLIMALTALVPSVAICILAYVKDRKEKEPVWLLCSLFSLSALLYYPVYLIGNKLIVPALARLFSNDYYIDQLAGVVWKNETSESFYLWLCALLGFALIEELARWLVLYVLTARSRHFNCTWDGILYSICVSMGASFARSYRFALTLGWDQFFLRFLRSSPWDLILGILMGVLYTAWFVNRKADRIENALLKVKRLNKNKLHYPVLFLAASIIVPITMHAIFNYYLEQIAPPNASVNALVVTGVALAFAIGVALILVISRWDKTHKETVEEIIEDKHGDLPGVSYEDPDPNRANYVAQTRPFLSVFPPVALGIVVIALALFAYFKSPGPALNGGAPGIRDDHSRQEISVPDPGSADDSSTIESASPSENSAIEPVSSNESYTIESEDSDDTSSDLQDGENQQGYFFYYDSLGEREKKIYNSLYKAFQNGVGEVTLKGFSVDDKMTIRKVVSLIEYDHPDMLLFNTRVVYYSSGKDGLTVSLNKYDYWEHSLLYDSHIAVLEGVIDRIVNNALSMYSDDYGKAKYVHDFLIENAVYDTDALAEIKSSPSAYSSDLDMTFTSYGCLVNGKCVCSGFAKAYKLIMDKLGIPCVYVVGWGKKDPTPDDLGHAWNRIVLDGDSYYLDVTWDNLSNNRSNDGQLLYPDAVSYKYFNITTDELLETHALKDLGIDQPVCTATKYNYYIYNDYLLETYDATQFAKLIIKQSGLKSINLRVLNITDLEAVKKDMWAALKQVGWENPAAFIDSESGHFLIVHKNKTLKQADSS